MFVKWLHCQKTHLINLCCVFCNIEGSLFVCFCQLCLDSQTWWSQHSGIKRCMTSPAQCRLSSSCWDFVMYFRHLLVSDGIWDLNKKGMGWGGWLSCYLTFFTPNFWLDIVILVLRQNFLEDIKKSTLSLTVPWLKYKNTRESRNYKGFCLFVFIPLAQTKNQIPPLVRKQFYNDKTGVCSLG